MSFYSKLPHWLNAASLRPVPAAVSQIREDPAFLEVEQLQEPIRSEDLQIFEFSKRFHFYSI
jgi:hypothetical protein